MADPQPDSKDKADERRELNRYLDGLASDVFDMLRKEWKCVNENCETFPKDGKEVLNVGSDFYVLNCGHYICKNCKERITGFKDDTFEYAHWKDGDRDACHVTNGQHINRDCGQINNHPIYDYRPDELKILPRAHHINDVMKVLRMKGVECKTCPKEDLPDSPVKQERRGIICSCISEIWALALCISPRIYPEGDPEEVINTEAKVYYHRDRMVLYVGELDEEDKMKLNELREHRPANDAKIAQLLLEKNSKVTKMCDVCAKKKHLDDKTNILSIAKFSKEGQVFLDRMLNDTTQLNQSGLRARWPWYLQGPGRKNMFRMIGRLIRCQNSNCGQPFVSSVVPDVTRRVPVFLNCGHIVCNECENIEKYRDKTCGDQDCRSRDQLNVRRFPPQDVMKILLEYNSGGERLLTVDNYPKCGKCDGRLPAEHMIQSGNGGEPTCTFCYFDYPSLKQ